MSRVGSIIRPVGLITNIRQGIRAQTDRGWPTCFHCRNTINGYQPPVDAVEMVDQNATSITVLAKHHGKEDAIRIDFPWTPDEDDMSAAWRSLEFFNPELTR